MLHLLRILDIKHWRDGEVVWEASDLPNTLHRTGELYALRGLFATASQDAVPFYYVGMDNRTDIAVNDTITSLSGEPTVNGYQRQAVSAASGFTVTLNESSGHYEAVSGVLTFTASGGTWGPVLNLFLATSNGNSGLLISSVQMDGTHYVSNGESLTVRLGVRLWDSSLV